MKKALAEILKTCEAGAVMVHETGKPQWSALDHIKGLAKAGLAEAEKTDLLTVKVKVREVYGVRRVYVQSAHLGPLKKLTGRETLTESDISALKALGYTVEIEAEKVTL